MQAKLRALSLLEHISPEVVELSRGDCMRHVQAWLKVYGAPVFAEHGRWVLGEFLWHTFSFGYTPHEDASLPDVLRGLDPRQVLVMSANTSQLWGFRCASMLLEEFVTHRADLIAFPEKQDWTVALTHDFVNGPFFSRAEWVDANGEPLLEQP